MALFILSVLFFFLTIFGSPKQDISVSAEAFVLMNPWSKKVLYCKNPNQKLSPASTVKIMTAISVLKKSHLKKKVLVSQSASAMEPSKVHIKKGEIYWTGDLLEALLLNSGNDASVALAESVGRSEDRFTAIMNEIAKYIGARNTNFGNSSGLPKKGQYSTAYDLALIVREAMKHKGIVSIMEKKVSEIEELGSKRQIRLKNHNKSLWKGTPYLILGKTGYTKKARHCFAGYIQYNRWHKVIVVILKSEKLWGDLRLLAEWLM